MHFWMHHKCQFNKTIHIIIHFILSFNNIISIHKDMWKIQQNFCITIKLYYTHLFPTSTNIYLKSLVEKYRAWHTKLSDSSLVKFITNYNTRTCKIHKHISQTSNIMKFQWDLCENHKQYVHAKLVGFKV
jgi:hypothetical protein